MKCYKIWHRGGTQKSNTNIVSKILKDDGKICQNCK